jgi:3-dehydroquinate dehydratase/shikimate dehydrogenase
LVVLQQKGRNGLNCKSRRDLPGLFNQPVEEAFCVYGVSSVSTSLLCQTVTGTTTAELRAQRDGARSVDMVELRLDGVADPDVRAVLAGRRLPVVVTCRPTWEGGRFDGSEAERRHLLEQAVDAGAEYVDVEWRAGWTDLISRRQGRGVVLSLHDFNGVPADLPDVYRSMRQTGAEVIKIAVTATRLCDVFALEPVRTSGSGGLMPDTGHRTSDFVFVAMGSPGVASRILPGRFGSRWTYAGAEAPGQMTAERLLTEFRFRDIRPATGVYGVVGARASRSLSPSLHNAAFRAGGVDAVYLPLETDEFDDFLAFADRLPLAGASVTMPFKEIAMQRAGTSDEVSRCAGAANTIRREATGWRATNTDVEGFLDPIRDTTLRGRRVAILGAGGAAKAVAVAVARQGASVAVYARTRERGCAVATLVGGAAFDGLPARGAWDVLVNATPVGSTPDTDRTPIPADHLTGQLVYDLVYDPPDTRLLREARAAGCRTVGGFEMLLAQARRQSEWWTGRMPDEGAMRAAMLRLGMDQS